MRAPAGADARRAPARAQDVVGPASLLADGRAPMRVGALLRMRLRSERLPNKALQPIAGRPVFAHILDRMFAARSVCAPSDVIACITDDPSDDPLVAPIEATGARVYRGSEQDLVERLWGAVRERDFDVVIQVDGDDVCVDPLYMDLCVLALLLDETLDVAVCEGQPVGIGSKALRTRAIERVASRYLPSPNGTGAMLYFTDSGLCKVATVRPIGPEHVHDDARLTLDYPRDLDLFRALFAELYRPGEVFGIGEIVSLLRRRPELVAINGSLADEYRERSGALIEAEALRYRDAQGDLHTLEVSL
jgi:spore coat polysaccharide biosynthesis protein SpsF